MGRVITGAASIAGAGAIVTAWNGLPLTEINCPEGSPVAIEGRANFVKARLSTTSFEIEVPHAGAGGTGIVTAISAMTPTEVSVGALNARTATVIQQLSVLDANGRGLFYNLIGVTGANDPGPGNLAFNNAAPALVTEIYLDVLDANEGGRDVVGLLGLMTPGTVLVIRSLATTAYASFRVIGGSGTLYRTFAVAYVGADGSLGSEPVAVEWRLPGADKDVDATVDTLAGLDAFDAESAEFRVFVNDVGNGRAARYTKLSATAGDWSGPGFFTGAASTVPGPPGVVWRGTYNPATAYVPDDGVLYNGSSFRKMIVSAAGNAPPALPSTSNTHWELIAAKGTDGTGTGDVVGAASAVDGQIAAANGTTGRSLKFLTTAQVTAAMNVVVGDAGSGGTKGLVPAPGAGDAAAVKYLRADGTWAAIVLTDLEMSVSLLALQVADNTNVALFLGPAGNRVADSFDALTYVDVAGATNLNSSVAGLLKPTVTLPVTAYANAGGNGNRTASITVTSNRTPDAGVMGNLVDGSTAAGPTNSIDFPASINANDYMRFDFGVGVAKYIDEATLKSSASPGAGTWKVQASNDASTWTDLTSNGAATFEWDSTAKVVTLAGVAASGFRYYQLVKATTQSTSDSYYTEVEFKIAAGVSASTNNLTVRSASFTAASAPVKMKALIRVKEVDAATAGTDYTLECSRDGGTTWSTMTLTELFTSPSPTAGIRVVEAAETSVSGQPSGTAPRWRFKTLNNKNVELHDVYLYWS